jgi:alpha-1,6-mannosyltransferase
MKIVDVCAFYSPCGGGVKTYIEQKLAIGPQLGHEIVILAPGDHHEVIEHGPRARIITLPSPRFPLDRKYWYFGNERALHKALNKEAPDLVEASSPWRSPSMVARWAAPVPRSLVMHADPLSAYAYRWLEPLFSRTTIDRQFNHYWEHLRRLGCTFDQIVCANRDLSNRLQVGGVANVVVRTMGVEKGLFSPNRASSAIREALLAECGLPPSASLLVSAGRLASEKRWPFIVHAVTAASQHRPIGLVLLGEGREKRSILSAIGGNPHIRLFTPERDRARFATILASADAVIHGCEAETFCMVAAEASASGTPVIVPDQGGASDHALGGYGFTYAPANPLAIQTAILRCLGSKNDMVNPKPPRTMDDHFRELFNSYELMGSKVRHAA